MVDRVCLEVCVDSVAGLTAAIDGGADRIELCAALSEGGLTPSAGLMHLASKTPVPCYAMIRPRGGDFVFSTAECSVMEQDIAQVRAAGLAGVVLGAATSRDQLDLSVLSKLCHAAIGLGMTLHRVVDMLDDPVSAVQQAKSLGFERILTSGGAPSAPQGQAVITRMVRQAGRALSIMPGGGVSPDGVFDLLRQTGAREVHASCRNATQEGTPHPIFGAVSGITNQTTVSMMRHQIDQISER
jgi:copper homeostasis protein